MARLRLPRRHRDAGLSGVGKPEGVLMTAAKRQRLTDMPPAQQAGILCNDPRFQKFAATRCGMSGKQFETSAAAEYLRNCCNITSRRDLNTSQIAQNRFQTLRTEFDAWTGKIATPR
ncbi:MAG: hypothetical protein ACI92Z_003614 [Paracoccaceae bacterium]|jgi:hypothetical protein